MTPSQWFELIKILANLGGTVVIAALLMYLIYKLVNRLGVPFIDSQKQIAGAMGEQAQCMVAMQKTVNDYVCRDNKDHREILLSTQVVISEVKNLAAEIRESRNESTV